LLNGTSTQPAASGQKHHFRELNLNLYSDAEVAGTLIKPVFFQAILEMYPEMMVVSFPDEDFLFPKGKF